MDYLTNFPAVPPIASFILVLWGIIWKGLALWRASKQDQRNWFIAILVLNTLGILEIIYLFKFAKKKMELRELKFWQPKP